MLDTPSPTCEVIIPKAEAKSGYDLCGTPATKVWRHRGYRRVYHSSCPAHPSLLVYDDWELVSPAGIEIEVEDG